MKRYFSASALKLKQTKLYDFHVAQGGKMVDFAGYQMPVQYKEGVLQSHFWTREKASIFDVSHMLQTRFYGKDQTKFLETLVVGDLQGLSVGSSTLSLFTNEKGGIIDDTVINKQSDKHFYVVSNAGCADKDLAHIRTQLSSFTAKGGDCGFEILDNVSLVALQGPAAARVLEQLVGQDLKKFAFMSGKFLEVAGIPCYVSRCGYTGEDGFEISVPHERVQELCEVMLNDGDVKLAGLGARDSLRLEAGLCLYGHDLNDDITPVEGALTWTIGQRRRKEGGFLGADIILPQIKGGVDKRRVGFIVQGAPAREHSEIFSNGEKVGVITSGCPSPCLKKNVAMGYIKHGLHKSGTEVEVKVRNKLQKAVVTKMPFVPARYHRVE